MFLLTFTSLTISLDSSLDFGIDKTFWVYGHNPLEFFVASIEIPL